MFFSLEKKLESCLTYLVSLWVNLQAACVCKSWRQLRDDVRRICFLYHLHLIINVVNIKCGSFYFGRLWNQNCYAIISHWSNYNILDEDYQAVWRFDENLYRLQFYSWCFKVQTAVSSSSVTLGVCHSDLDKSCSVSVVCYYVEMCLQSDKALDMLQDNWI